MSNHSPDSTSTSRSRTPVKTTLGNIEDLYKNDIISQEEFMGIMQKIKDKGNIKDWCSEYVCILSSICEKSQCYRFMHENSNTYYKNLSYRITYTSMFFSGLMSAFSIVSTKIGDIIPPNTAALISGLGHLVVAGVTGFQKKMNLPESAEMHEKASQNFDILCRSIEFQLTLPIDDRIPVPKLVFDSINKYENLVISNPPIPHSILNYFRHSIDNLSINKPSIVNNFTMMPKSLDDNIICDSEHHVKHIWTPCDKELRRINSKGRKIMPELSPTIRKINTYKINKLKQHNNKEEDITKNNNIHHTEDYDTYETHVDTDDTCEDIENQDNKIQIQIVRRP